jgi:hypothetical protein
LYVRETQRNLKQIKIRQILSKAASPDPADSILNSDIFPKTERENKISTSCIRNDIATTAEMAIATSKLDYGDRTSSES